MDISHQMLAHMMHASDNLDILLPNHAAELSHNRRLFQRLIERFPEEPFSRAPNSPTQQALEISSAAVIDVLQHLPSGTEVTQRRIQAEQNVRMVAAKIRASVLDQELPETEKPSAPKPRF